MYVRINFTCMHGTKVQAYERRERGVGRRSSDSALTAICRTREIQKDAKVTDPVHVGSLRLPVRVRH